MAKCGITVFTRALSLPQPACLSAARHERSASVWKRACTATCVRVRSELADALLTLGELWPDDCALLAGKRALAGSI